MTFLFHSDQIAKALNVSAPELLVNDNPTTQQVDCPSASRLAYLFPDLHKDPDNFLDTSPATVDALQKLGLAMNGTMLHDGDDSDTPSAYTYFGQFAVHNLSLIPNQNMTLLGSSPTPLSFQVVHHLANPKSGLLDLSNVYGVIQTDTDCYALPREADGKRLRVDKAVNSDQPGTDLPRVLTSPHPAMISDARDDENLIISQLHLAFLRAHNLLISKGATYEQARALLTQRYQHLLIHDLLPRLVSKKDIEAAKGKAHIYLNSESDFFLPVEFAAAVFRFGHSMIRMRYDFNKQRMNTPLSQLFMPTALGNYHHILADWIIDWTKFLEGGSNHARKLNPIIVEPLSHLIVQDPAFSLAVRDLLRGYQLKLPTGQAVAKALGVTPLTESEVLTAAANDAQRKVLIDSGMSKRTPLWFYLFVESTNDYQGTHLGHACGQLLAIVLLELDRRSDTGISDAEWDPIFGPKETFDLAQFLEHVSVLN